MKDFFHTRAFRGLIIVVFVMFGLMVYSSLSGGGIFNSIAGFVTIPMQKITTMVANNAAQTAGELTQSADELQKENAELKKQIEELTERLIDYEKVKTENEQYREYLELKAENRDFQFVSGAVVGRDPNDLFGSFYVDKGTLYDVAVNDPVITTSGVAGWVSSVSETYCEVTTILSPDTGIAAIDRMNQESGVINNNIQYSDQGLMKLGYLSADTKVEPGDIIVTTGLGGVYPSNLPIGTVQEVFAEEYDVSYSALVKPMVDVKTIKDVFIITDFEGQGKALDTGGDE